MIKIAITQKLLSKLRPSLYHVILGQASFAEDHIYNSKFEVRERWINRTVRELVLKQCL